MDKQYEENSYNTYSLSTNLTNRSKEFNIMYRMSSPVLIQSYGSNNFVVELKHKNSNKIKNNYNDDYDYIENELKNTKKTKAYTTYTEISNEESLFFCAQNPPSNQKYYRDYTNYNNYYPGNIYNTNNDKYFLRQNNNYQINKKEDIDTLIYPQSDKIYLPKKNSNDIGHNRSVLKYQRFCASFISSNPSSNKNSPQRASFQKKGNHINNNISQDKKKSSLSKPKNQLEEFNIDKLKEIGDNFALRYYNRINQQKKINLKNRQNANIINIEIFNDKKEKHDGLINKMIIIEEKRKESKNKMKLVNKTEDKLRNDKNRIAKLDKKVNYELKNLNPNYIYETKKLNPNYNHESKKSSPNNILNNKTKIIKMNKKEVEQLNKSPLPLPSSKKIYLNNYLKKKKHNFQINNNSNEKFIYNIKDNNIESRDNYKILPNQLKINNYVTNRTYISQKNEKLDNKFNKNNYNNKRVNKILNVNNEVVAKDKSKGNNENLKANNTNHNYLESFNIKSNKKVKRTQHSFNNVFLPLQK